MVLEAGKLRAALAGLADDALVSLGDDHTEEDNKGVANPGTTQPQPAASSEPKAIRPRHLHSMIEVVDDEMVAPAHITRVKFGKDTIQVYIVGRRQPYTVTGDRDIQYVLHELAFRGFID
jgi:hypothetical protein